MVERMDAMLELRDQPEEMKRGGAKTMAEIADRFQRSLDELVEEAGRRGIREGARYGRQVGQVLLLRRQIVRKFGDDTAGELYGLLHYLTSLDNIDRVTDALLECGTGKEFIERVQSSAASHASDRRSAASPADTSPLDVPDVGRVRDVDARTLTPSASAALGTIRREWGWGKGSTIWADLWSRQEPETLEELMDKFQRGLDELFERGAREGARQILRRQITRRFSEHTAVQLSGLLATLAEPDRIDEVTDALIECGTGEEFIERVRTA